MSSIGTPTSSATICASVVSRPWPCEATPNTAVTLPAGSTRMVAASVPVAIGTPGATGIAEPIPVSST